MITKRTLTRDMPDRSRVVAHLEVRRSDDPENPHALVGGLSPAFSLTGKIYEAHGTWSGAARQRNGAEWDGGGCCHDEILRAFPRLAQFAKMHLADPETGEPMHAEANGWYWYAGSRADLRATEQYTGFDRIYAHQLAKRGLSDDDAGREEYCYGVACRMLRVDSIPRDLDREAFAQFVDDQRERWAREAVEARAFVESLPETNNAGEEEDENREEWQQVFGDGSTRLVVTARVTNYGRAAADLRPSTYIGGQQRQPWPNGGPCYVYDVTVSARGSRYTTKFYGSIADYEAGKVDAREAGLCVLREMLPLVNQSADDYMREMGFELDEPDADTRRTIREMRRMERAVDKMRDALSVDLVDLVG